MDQELLVEHCEKYLAARTGNYRRRCERYAAAYQVMQANGGLTDNDILLDLGAGWTELDIYLRREQDWRGRYWAIDGWMGLDIAKFLAPREVDWTVLLEVVEHFVPFEAETVVARAKMTSQKGVVLTTPNPATTDVLGMDADHKFHVFGSWLVERGFKVEVQSLYGQPDDSLLAYWTPGFIR